ncbi:MAG: hypothetical protein WC485_03620 [Opitutaceae bacterium]
MGWHAWKQKFPDTLPARVFVRLEQWKAICNGLSEIQKEAITGAVPASGSNVTVTKDGNTLVIGGGNLPDGTTITTDTDGKLSLVGKSSAMYGKYFGKDASGNWGFHVLTFQP